VPSYTILEAAVYYRTAQWDATVNVRNLTDKTYYTTPTFSGALPAEPLNAMLTLRYRIGQ
jgi:iron complex outermembrane receptor protein